MIIKLSVDETVRSIELGKKSAFEIFDKNKIYSNFYLNYLIEKSKQSLKKFNYEYIKTLIKSYSKIFKIISDKDKVKFAMESVIEDIAKCRSLINFCETEIENRGY